MSRILVKSFGCLVALVLAVPALAADAPAPGKPPFDPAKAQDGGLGLPTPYDKFIALDQALPKGRIDWAKAYRASAVSLDPDSFKDPAVAVPLALGVRIADGVMAVKAKNAELLNQCASDIERLAKTMGITGAELSRARAVRTAANKGEWLQVFLDLGFFQQDIMNRIEAKKDSTPGTLLVVGGWMEATRFTVPIIRQNYTPELSNLLREPLLVKALIEKMDALPEGVKSQASVSGLRKILPELLKLMDIPKDGSISKENLVEVQRLADQAVKLATQAGK